MNDAFWVFLSLSLSGSLLAAPILLLRPLLRDRISKAWQYYIWLVVLLRLLVPLSPQISLVGTLFKKADTHIAAVTQPRAAALDQAPSPTAPQNSPALLGRTAAQAKTAPIAPPARALWQTAASLLWIPWLGTAALLLLMKARAYRRSMRQLEKERRPVTDGETLAVYHRACAELGLRKAPPLYESTLLVSPMLAGILRSSVIMTRKTEEPARLRCIFLHELTHYRRRDMLFKWLAQATVCLHWFNPLVHAAFREIDRACELACDEAVMARCSTEQRKLYGDALVASIKGGASGSAMASVCLSEDLYVLKERLNSMMHYHTISTPMRAWAVVLTLLICMGAASVGAYALDGQTSSAPAALSDSTTPQGAVQSAMDALKKLDMPVFNTYSDNYRGTAKQDGKLLYKPDYALFEGLMATTPGSLAKKGELEFAQGIVERLEWTIGKVSEDPGGNSATLELNVTNGDFTDVTGLFTADVLKDTLNGSTENQEERDFLAYFKAVTKTITIGITAKAEKSGGQWRLLLDDALINAIMGNLNEGAENYSEDVQKKIDAAQNELNKRANTYADAFSDAFSSAWEKAWDEAQKNGTADPDFDFQFDFTDNEPTGSQP